MKTVSGRVISSKPISLSKAASTLSSFLSTDNGASPAICAYLRRAAASFNELKQLHKALKSSRSDRKHRNHKLEIISDGEAADKSCWSEVNEELNRIGVSEKKKSSVAESRSEKTRPEIETGVENEDSRDRDKSTTTLENRRKTHKKKSEDGIGKIEDNEREAGARESDTKLRNTDGNWVGYGVGGDEGRIYENHMELPTKKKKRKQDISNVQNDGGEAMVRERMLVLDNGAVKRKNRDIEGGKDGLEEQLRTKRRKNKE